MKKPDVRAILGERIRYRREELDFTQKAFACYADLHRNYYGRIERGQQNVGIEALVRLAAHLETSVPELTAGLTDLFCLEFVECEHRKGKKGRIHTAHGRGRGDGSRRV